MCLLVTSVCGYPNTFFCNTGTQYRAGFRALLHLSFAWCITMVAYAPIAPTMDSRYGSDHSTADIRHLQSRLDNFRIIWIRRVCDGCDYAAQAQSTKPKKTRIGETGVLLSANLARIELIQSPRGKDIRDATQASRARDASVRPMYPTSQYYAFDDMRLVTLSTIADPLRQTSHAIPYVSGWTAVWSGAD